MPKNDCDMRTKVLPPDSLKRTVDELRLAGRKIVFTNGCFDLLHVGHLRYLSKARACGDILVVGLNSDASVRTIKGDKRPIVSQMQRAEILAGLACVDYVTLFDEPDPLSLILLLMPDVLVKGADWPEDKIVGAREVKENGGEVVRVEFVPGESTTGIVERIVAAYGSGRKAK